MKTFELTARADATLEEIWEVVAETEEEARAKLLAGPEHWNHDITFIGQESKDERNRLVTGARESRNG